MRYLIFIILIIALGGALLGQWVLRDSGYILLSYQDVFVETSLWFGMVLFLCSLLFLLFLFQLIVVFFGLPVRVRKWRLSRSDRRAVEKLRGGVLDLIGGYAARSYASMRASSRVENKLVAAESAYRLKKYEQAMDLLKSVKTDKLDKNIQQRAVRAIAFMQARIHIGRKEYEEALAALTPLMKEKRESERLNYMLRDIYIKTNQWRKLAELLRTLERFSSRAEMLRHYQLYMRNENSSDTLSAFWDGIPTKYRKDPLLIGCYAINLARGGGSEKAEMILVAALQKKYDALLVDAYKEVESGKPLKQLHFLETLMKKGREDKNILAALAHLSIRNRLVNKAKDYYEKLVDSYQAEPADRLAYAELLNQSNNAADKKMAQEMFYSLAESAANTRRS